MSENVKGADLALGKREMTHGLVGLVLAFIVGYLLQGVPYITPAGGQVLGILVATLYWWNMVDNVWTDFIVPIALGFTALMPMNEALASFWGKPMILQIFFMVVLMSNLVYNKIPSHIGQFVIKQTWLQGRPMVFTTAIYLVSYLSAMLIGPFAPIFLLWPMCYEIFDLMDYKKTEAFPKAILVGIVTAALMGFASPIYMGFIMGLSQNFTAVSEEFGQSLEISSSAYLVLVFILTLVTILAFNFLTFLVFKPNTQKFKNFDYSKLDDFPLPPMTKNQKALSLTFFIYVMCMLLPGLFPTAPILSTMVHYTTAMSMICAIFMMVVHVEGEPLMDFTTVTKTFAWPAFLRMASAFMLGAAVTSVDTGVADFINHMVTPMFGSMGFMAFGISLIILTFILNNLTNCLIISMLIQPVIVSYCFAKGFDPTGLAGLAIFFSLVASGLMPGASPVASILYGNKEWLTKKEVQTYLGLNLGVFLLVVMALGLPLSQILF